MKRPRGTGSILRMKESAVWWIKFHRHGKPIRESSHSTKVKDAEKLLQKRLGEVGNNSFVAAADRRATVDELYLDLLDDYRNNQMASLEGAEQRWKKRLKGFFGGWHATDVTTASLNRYVSKYRDSGLANGTINRDLSALRRALYLAAESTPPKLQQVPKFPHLKEANPRQGFVEEREYRRLREHVSSLWLRALLVTAYTFGFRKGEPLNLKVGAVDLINHSIRLYPGETKSGRGRVVKMTADVYVLLQACVAGKAGDDCFVFTREDGKPVKDFREAWEALTVAAGTPGLRFHDLRRSAVRNMVRSGVTEKVAMTISGHETRSVFDRYNIVNESDLAEAARKIEAGQKPDGPVWAEFGQSHEKKNDSAALIPLTVEAAN